MKTLEKLKAQVFSDSGDNKRISSVSLISELCNGIGVEKMENFFFNLSKKKLIVGSKWVSRFPYEDDFGIVFTPTPEETIYFVIKEVDELFVKYYVEFGGSSNPDNFFSQTIKRFILTSKSV